MLNVKATAILKVLNLQNGRDIKKSIQSLADAFKAITARKQQYFGSCKFHGNEVRPGHRVSKSRIHFVCCSRFERTLFKAPVTLPAVKQS